MRARYIKILVWVVALIVVWNLGQTYTVANSLFVFAAAGVIPGTSIALNPNQVLLCLASMLFVSVLLIFSTNISRGVRRLYAVWKRRTAAVETSAQPRPVLAEVAMAPIVVSAVAGPTPKATRKKASKTPKPQPVVVIKAPKRPSKALLLLHIAGTLVALVTRSTAARVRAHFPRLAAALAKAATAVRRTVLRELQLAALAVGLGVMAVLRAVRAVFRFTAATVRWVFTHTIAAIQYVIVYTVVSVLQAGLFTGRSATRLWRWLEPRLRTFDAWLGVHYNRGLQAGRSRVIQSDLYRSGMRLWRRTVRLLASMRDDLRAALARSFQK